MRAAGTCAVNVLIFTKSAVSGMLFQSTVDDGVKLYPVTVSVNVGCPAEIFVGEIAAIVGLG